MTKELKQYVEELRKKLSAMEGHLGIAAKQKRLADIEQESAHPDFWNDSTRAKGLSKEQDALKIAIAAWDTQRRQLRDVEAILELIGESQDEELSKEANSKLQSIDEGLEAMEFQRMLSGETDRNGAILMINAGAGGTEACDWAEILLRMYARWADRHGFRAQVVDFTEGDGAGFRSATLTIDGEYAYGYLKAENGVHRLVRISPFDANKRRHTSFTSVYAIAEVEEDIAIEIRSDDLRVDTFRAGGAGGQHVNKTDSAVRLTHIPTNTVVACRSERSQYQNKERAMKLLKAKLYDLEMEKKRQALDAAEKKKKKIEWGSQIRSYVMQPYQLVKDHRTGFEIGNVQSVLDGDLDAFMKKYLLEFASE